MSWPNLSTLLFKGPLSVNWSCGCFGPDWPGTFEVPSCTILRALLKEKVPLVRVTKRLISWCKIGFWTEVFMHQRMPKSYSVFIKCLAALRHLLQNIHLLHQRCWLDMWPTTKGSSLYKQAPNFPYITSNPWRYLKWVSITCLNTASRLKRFSSFALQQHHTAHFATH